LAVHLILLSQNLPPDPTAALGGASDPSVTESTPNPAAAIGGPSGHSVPKSTPPIGGPSAPNKIVNKDDLARRAIISYNTFDILEPPRPLSFGEYNPRALNNLGVTALADTFLNGIFTPFRHEAMIPISLHPSELDQSCINAHSNLGVDSPPLVLSSKGLQLAALKAFGGNHRLNAVKRVLAILDKQIKDFADKIKALERSQTKRKPRKGKRKSKAKAGDDDEDSLSDADIDETNDVAYLRTQRDLLEDRKRYYRTWGVVIYDTGMPFLSFLLHMYLSS
jgi:hypothetical protein